VAIRFRASPRFVWKKYKNTWDLVSISDGICFLTLRANSKLRYETEEGLYFPEFNKPMNCCVLVAKGSQISRLNVLHEIIII